MMVNHRQKGILKDLNPTLLHSEMALLTLRTDEVCLNALHLTASSVTDFGARLSFQMFGLRLQKSEENIK